MPVKSREETEHICELSARQSPEFTMHHLLEHVPVKLSVAIEVCPCDCHFL